MREFIVDTKVNLSGRERYKGFDMAEDSSSFVFPVVLPFGLRVDRL